MDRSSHYGLSVARRRMASIVAAATCALPSCRPADDDTLVVFAAASTAAYVESVADTHAAATGRTIKVHAAATSLLARQIEDGARADVFVSAHPDWMAYLDERGRLVGTPVVLFGNDLVVAVRDDADPVRLDDASAWPDRIAVGDPAHVPVGRYADAALTALGLDAVRARIVPALDTRAAVEMLARGHVDAAIVYASDVDARRRLVVTATFPAASHPPIVYTAAVIDGARRDAASFTEALRAAATPDGLRAFGFRALEAGAAP